MSDQFIKLLSSMDQLSKALCGKENATFDELLQAANQLKSSLAQAEREREAAVHDLTAFALNSEKELACDFCGAASPLICQQCEERPDGFKWRGVCEENTNDQP